MNLLILGGTAFVGRAVTEVALAQGHDVTLFNRGRRNADLFPHVEKLVGDREKGEVDSLKGRTWDAVVDMCGYVPRIVGQSARLLAGFVGTYVFVSSVSVYSDFSAVGIDETAPTGKLDDETVEEITGETYGPLKVHCERAVEDAFAGRALILRPGLIVGPNDPTDRFTYWPARIANGGAVAIPDRTEAPVQIIDARDIAEFALHALQTGCAAAYNLVGPAEPITFGEMLDACVAATGSGATFVPISESFLLEFGVKPWIELPLWLPESENADGIGSVCHAKAIAAGLKFRPLIETIRDTLAWNAKRPPDVERRAGLTSEREVELSRAWNERSATD